MNIRKYGINTYKYGTIYTLYIIAILHKKPIKTINTIQGL